MADLSIVVPTFSRHSALQKLLNSLVQQELYYQNRSLQIEILVVDNFFDVYNQRWLQELSRTNQEIQFKYLYTGSKGSNKARNLGLSLATGEIIIFIDDDCYPANSGYLKSIYQLHKTYLKVTGIGGHYILPEAFSLVELADHNNSQAWIQKCQIKGTPFTSQLLGGNASFKKDHILPKMKFNENIIYGGAEYDFNLRLQIQGLQLSLHEDLGIIHELKLSLVGFLKKAFMQGFGQAQIERTLGKDVVDLYSAHVDYSINEHECSKLEHNSKRSAFLFLLESAYSVFFDAGKLYGYKLSQKRLLQAQNKPNFKIIYYVFKVFLGASTIHLSAQKMPTADFFPEHKRRIPQLRFYSIFYWTRPRIVTFFKRLLRIG